MSSASAFVEDLTARLSDLGFSVPDVTAASAPAVLASLSAPLSSARAALGWPPAPTPAASLPPLLALDAAAAALATARLALVHRMHHTFTAPFALAAVYAHPLEHLLSNVLPISLGPLLMRSHPATAALWAAIAIFSTCGAHSGYLVRGLTRSAFHDHHHQVFLENYGVLGDTPLGLDWWLGTSRRYWAKKAAAPVAAAAAAAAL